MAAQRKYPEELRERAVKAVLEIRERERLPARNCRGAPGEAVALPKSSMSCSDRGRPYRLLALTRGTTSCNPGSLGVTVGCLAPGRAGRVVGGHRSSSAVCEPSSTHRHGRTCMPASYWLRVR
jgi:hypothetical protein